MKQRDTGYALVKKLREDADDCQRPDRAELLRSAANEIESLIEEIKEVEKGK